MSQIELIGVSGSSLAPEHWPLIRRCVAIVVSRRFRPIVVAKVAEMAEGSGLHCPLIEITPLETMLCQVEQNLAKGDVAILATGDPLFYGIGRSLINRFGSERITIHPALSAVQLACARFHLPWDGFGGMDGMNDLALISLHGKTAANIPGRILRHQRVLLLTDGHNTPNQVAATVLAALTACGDEERISSIRIRVAENLGLADERLIAGSLQDIASRTFGPLNIVLLEQTPQATPATVATTVRFGLTEAAIHHSRGLITKDEVRAATLHRLCLPSTGIFWDIGGGSGSVSLEAARLCPELSIYTIEKKPEEQANICANIRRFGAYSIHLINGEAPAALAELPAPDRIFIGGSGQKLEAIIEKAVARLSTGGRIVINAVLEQTESTAVACLHRLGLQVSTSTLAVTRRSPANEAPRIFNPITLITGDK